MSNNLKGEERSRFDGDMIRKNEVMFDFLDAK